MKKSNTDISFSTVPLKEDLIVIFTDTKTGKPKTAFLKE
jgi:hypothetical protein